MNDIPEEQLVKKGRMIKSPWTMSPEEYQVWQLQQLIEIKE